jgi:hypothetical protein
MLFLSSILPIISMKQQEVFKKIGGIIREINEQYEYLETVDGVLNELELELMVANSHFLTDHIEILRKLNAQTQAIAPTPLELPAAETKPSPAEPLIEPRYFEPFTAQTEEAEVVNEPVTYLDETPATTIEFDVPRHTEDHTDHFPAVEELQAEEPQPEAIPEPATIRHELTLDDIGGDWDEDEEPEIIAEKPAPQPEYVPEPVAEKPAPEEVKFEEPEPAPVAIVPEPVKPEPVYQKPEPIADKPIFTPVVQPRPVEQPHTQILVEESQVLTLNERMSAQMATSRMADQLQGQAISDLKSAINLNDKLLYIKDLFNGYGLAYSEAIDNLNRFKTFEEAESFLKATYSVKNNWQDKQATADKFYALLQRRYLS